MPSSATPASATGPALDQPRPQGRGSGGCRWLTPALALGAFCLAAGPASAATGTAGVRDWLWEVFGKIRSPWFWFGMTAQFVFFMRFVVQWIVSERRRRSTVPIAFWYLSLVGSLALFIYAAHQRNPVIMAGQFLACFIYVRNLMLIRERTGRRRRAGLPAETTASTDDDAD